MSDNNVTIFASQNFKDQIYQTIQTMNNHRTLQIFRILNYTLTTQYSDFKHLNRNIFGTLWITRYYDNFVYFPVNALYILGNEIYDSNFLFLNAEEIESYLLETFPDFVDVDAIENGLYFDDIETINTNEITKFCVMDFDFFKFYCKDNVNNVQRLHFLPESEKYIDLSIYDIFTNQMNNVNYISYFSSEDFLKFEQKMFDFEENQVYHICMSNFQFGDIIFSDNQLNRTEIAENLQDLVFSKLKELIKDQYKNNFASFLLLQKRQYEKNSTFNAQKFQQMFPHIVIDNMNWSLLLLHACNYIIGM